MQDYAGYRTRKRREKKKRKKWWRWVVALVALLAVFVLLGAVFKISPLDRAWDDTYDGLEWAGRGLRSLWPFKGSRPVPAAAWLPEGKTTANYLFTITKQVNDGPLTTVCFLASYDSETGSGSLIYFPNDLLVNVPGIGMDQLNNLVAVNEGRISLTLVTIENLLGIEIDRYIMGTDRDVRIVLNQMSSTWTVIVASKTSFKDPGMGIEVNLQPGKQNLSPNMLASYLTYAPAGQEVDLCKRLKQFAVVFLDKSEDLFGDIEGLVAKNATLFDTDASDRELAGIWKTYATLGSSRLQQAILPVKEFRFEQTVVHRVDQDALPAFIRKYVKTASSKETARRYKVEILNGNGVPGIGESVAAKLDMRMFQVVNSANADNFEHPDTVLLIYENDPGVVNAAEQVTKELEAGRIEFRPKTQDISDITIIVGKDYAQK